MRRTGLSWRDRVIKRAIDIAVAAAGLVATAPLNLAIIAIATLDTRQWGVFSQVRVGRDGELFRVHKVRTMRAVTGQTTTITAANDVRITRFGRLLRRTKLDELPQLYDVLVGNMSLVGPRPDVPGYADQLTGDDRRMLTVRPGITGPAALAYRNEENLLADADDPETYNDEIIWPAKVRINCDYVENYSLRVDYQVLRDTLASTLWSTK